MSDQFSDNVNKVSIIADLLNNSSESAAKYAVSNVVLGETMSEFIAEEITNKDVQKSLISSTNELAALQTTATKTTGELGLSTNNFCTQLMAATANIQTLIAEHPALLPMVATLTAVAACDFCCKFHPEMGKW